MGPVSVACTDAGVARVTYGPPPGPEPRLGTLASVLLEATLEELARYFGGHLKRFSVPVDLGSAQGARRAVLSVLHQTVGFGQTITYGGLAARAGLSTRTLARRFRDNRAAAMQGTRGELAGGLSVPRSLTESQRC